MNGKVDFVAIATPLVERGFRVTPVHPETKMGVMKNWQKFQLTTIDDIRKYAEYFPHHNVGVVGKRGVGRHCFLDVDARGVVERIEHDTKQTMPKGYRVQSSPPAAGAGSNLQRLHERGLGRSRGEPGGIDA